MAASAIPSGEARSCSRSNSLGGAERQHGGAGQEMVERLFLDGIDAEAAGAAVGRQHDFVVFSAADET
jgi:hypothetical protein